MTDTQGRFIEYTPEQLQMLTEHINKHTEQAGGMNPNFAQATEQAVSNQINAGINQPNQPTQQRAGTVRESA
jgi:hypothetical protein